MVDVSQANIARSTTPMEGFRELVEDSNQGRWVA